MEHAYFRLTSQRLCTNSNISPSFGILLVIFKELNFFFFYLVDIIYKIMLTNSFSTFHRDHNEKLMMVKTFKTLQTGRYWFLQHKLLKFVSSSIVAKQLLSNNVYTFLCEFYWTNCKIELMKRVLLVLREQFDLFIEILYC